MTTLRTTYKIAIGASLVLAALAAFGTAAATFKDCVDLRAEALDNGDVKLTWDNVPDGGSVFSGWIHVVFRDSVEIQRVTLDTLGQTEIMFTDEGSTPGVTHTYEVHSFEADGKTGQPLRNTSFCVSKLSITAIPFFPGFVVGALAVAAATGVYAKLRK